MIRLFNLDLPVLKNAGKTLPEQLDTSTISRILDVACGSGAWVLATAQAYPHMQVVGIDADGHMVDSARAQARARGLENASFTVMDPLHPLDIPDGSFDLVNTRFLAGLVSPETWPKLLSECLRITRRGGVILLTEGDMPVTNSPAFENLSGMIARALLLANQTFSPDGQTLIIAPMLRRLLQNAGCSDIQRVPSATNFSTGMEAHEALYQDFSHTYQLVQPFLIKMGVTTQEEVEQVYRQMLTEMQTDDFCAIGFYLSVWGKKP